MQIKHHIGFSAGNMVEPILVKLGIPFRKTMGPGGLGFVATFEIAETDPHWPRAAALVQEKQLLDVAYTAYEPREVLATEWVRFTPTNENGYPQPETKWKQATLAGGCRRCRVGSVQVAPYRIKKEPSTRRFDFMSLYWTYVMFATPRVFAVFSRGGFRGYDEWPVLIHRTGEPAEAMRQVYILSETEGGFVCPEGLNEEACPDCNQVTFDPVRRGPIRYRRQALPDGIDFARSHEWFGGTGHQEIFITQRVAQVIIENGWRGAKLEPVELF